jgi:hypothetical protein
MKITYEATAEHIFIRTEGTFDIEDVKTFLTEGVRQAKENNLRKLKVDHRDSPFKASVVEIYGVASNLVEFGFTPEFKGAVIYNMNESEYTFADKVSLNWSFGVIRFFNDESKAIAWLESDS